MSTYKLGVIPIPTNRPMIRKDQSRPRSTRTRPAKFAQVVEDIAERHAEGQPVLVGTVRRREERVPLAPAREEGHQARGPQREEPRARGRDRRARRPPGRSHRRHEPWPDEEPTSCSAETLSSSRSRSSRARGFDPVETPEEYEIAWDETYEAMKTRRRGGGREGHRGRRSLRARHRAPRVAPHRQPASRSFRPSG